MTRMARYLAPSVVTCVAMLFGLLSMVAALEGRFVHASWLIIWAVLFDRIDGLVARLLKATSEFGMHMDSLADAFNFGVAPAFLMYIALTSAPALGFVAGPSRTLLLVACLAWVLATVIRLAKFNVLTAEHPGMFFGAPTTLCAGTLVIWFLVALKYASSTNPLAPPVAFGGPSIIPGLEFSGRALRYFPPAMLGLSLLMVSNLPMPKPGRMKSRAFTIFVTVSLLVGFACGFLRTMPEVMAWMPTTWIILFLGIGQLSQESRKLRPGPVFPTVGEEEEEDEGIEWQQGHSRG